MGWEGPPISGSNIAFSHRPQYILYCSEPQSLSECKFHTLRGAGNPSIIWLLKLRMSLSVLVSLILSINRKYEGCSNMNASSFITIFTYMLRQNGKWFYKGLYVTFKLAPELKKSTIYLSSYSPLNEGHISILTNSILGTYTSDIDERIILR